MASSQARRKRTYETLIYCFFAVCKLTDIPTEGRYASINQLKQREAQARLLPRVTTSTDPITWNLEGPKNMLWDYRNSEEMGTNRSGTPAFVGVEGCRIVTRGGRITSPREIAADDS
jgi:hypothetical protein